MRVYLPTLHKGQTTVRSQSKRFNWLAAGRRWRKTSLGVVIAVENALDKKAVLWGAPTFGQVEIAWNEVKKACAEVAKFNETKKTVFFINGGVIIFRSLEEPDNIRGLTFDVIIFDECADIREAAWYQIARPMLMDTGGFAWFLGTPKRRNWFWREHVRALDSEDSMSWSCPTLGCEIIDVRGSLELKRKPHPLENPFINFDELKSLFNDMSERDFRQEILAEFLESTGGVFRFVRERSTEIALPYSYPSNFVMGIDWADNKDFTVISVFDYWSGKQVDLTRFNQIGYETQKTRVEGQYSKWNPLTVIGELNSMGKPIIEALRASGIPIIGFEMTAKTKPKLVRQYQLSFEKDTHRLINDELSIAEHEAYEQKTLKTGYSQYSAPEGMHDDIVVADMLAYYGMHSGAVEGVDEDVAVALSEFRGI